MWGSFIIKEDNCKNLTKWILLAHHVQAVLGHKTKGRCEPQSQLLVHTHVFFLKRKSETPVGLHVGGMIVFSISHL
jgi:hypothetical protein